MLSKTCFPPVVWWRSQGQCLCFVLPVDSWLPKPFTQTYHCTGHLSDQPLMFVDWQLQPTNQLTGYLEEGLLQFEAGQQNWWGDESVASSSLTKQKKKRRRRKINRHREGEREGERGHTEAQGQGHSAQIHYWMDRTGNDKIEWMTVKHRQRYFVIFFACFYFISILSNE